MVGDSPREGMARLGAISARPYYHLLIATNDRTGDPEKVEKRACGDRRGPLCALG